VREGGEVLQTIEPGRDCFACSPGADGERCSSWRRSPPAPPACPDRGLEPAGYVISIKPQIITGIRLAGWCR
jgi:hypothetical protein